jgi:hypothetical protein
VFLTKKISQFLFLAVEDILVLYLPEYGQREVISFFTLVTNKEEYSIKQTLTGKEVEKIIHCERCTIVKLLASRIVYID